MIELLISLFVLLTLSGVLSASETALFSLSSLKVKAYKQDKDPRKRQIANLLAHPQDLLVTIIIFNISVNILVQNVSSGIFGDLSGWLLNIGFPLVLTLLFGEVIPKSIGMARNEQIAYRVTSFLTLCQKLMWPLRRIIVGITSFVSRCLFFFLHKEQEISIDELQHALYTSHKSGVLIDEEAELARGFLALQQSIVKEQMRPREETLYFDLDESLSRLIHLFVDEQVSRVPICQKGLDTIVGIMTSRLFFLHRPLLNETKDLLAVLERPFFVPETTPAKVLLRQFYDRQESLAIVVDEYGSVSGLISLEDLVETVVGDIVDRRDEKSLYTRSGEDVIISSGKMEIAEVEKLFDVSLPSEHHMATIGGYLTEKIGDIPKAGAKWVDRGVLFQVLAADATRVRRVYIRRLRRRG